jgi:hypothetical protein
VRAWAEFIEGSGALFAAAWVYARILLWADDKLRGR